METTIIIFVIVAFIVGIAGTVLPIAPGTGLIFLGILAYAWVFGVETIGTWTLFSLGFATALSFLFDYLGSAYGAKRAGSTGWGVAGAILGGLVGLIALSIPGLILGVFFGAAIAEMIFAGKKAEQSFRIGLGSVIGFLGGAILKFLLGIVMIGVFLAKVFF